MPPLDVDDAPLPLPQAWALALAQPIAETVRVTEAGAWVRVPTTRSAAGEYLGRRGVHSRETLVRFIEHGLLAARPWETTYAVAVAAWGAVVDLHTSDEAWAFQWRAAARAQATFSSWTEYGEGYELDFDAMTDGRSSCSKEIARLLSAPRSPWVLLPWRIDLGTSPSVAAPA